MEDRMYTYINLPCNKILVIFQTWDRPDTYWGEIMEDLQKESLTTEIFFDFLLNNGPKDRFYSAMLDNGVLMFNSFKKISLDASYIKIANTYFANNLSLIENSVMTRLQKNIFKGQIGHLIY